jgi:hypothetical protein
LADKLFIKQSVVSSDDINYDTMECPECHNNKSIILNGYLMMPREEIFEEGKLIKQHTSKDLSFDVRQIYCLSCQTRSLVTDAHSFNLQRSNLLLNEQIRQLTGEDPLSLGPIN